MFGQRLQASAFYQWQQFRQRANFQEFNAGAPDFFNDNRTNSTAGFRLTLAPQFRLGPAEIGVEYGIDYQRNELIASCWPATTRHRWSASSRPR